MHVCVHVYRQHHIFYNIFYVSPQRLCTFTDDEQYHAMHTTCNVQQETRKWKNNSLFWPKERLFCHLSTCTYTTDMYHIYGTTCTCTCKNQCFSYIYLGSGIWFHRNFSVPRTHRCSLVQFKKSDQKISLLLIRSLTRLLNYCLHSLH